MDENNQYVASFETSEQISQYDWRVIRPSLRVTDETTVGEIREFYKKHEKSSPVHITINELEG